MGKSLLHIDFLSVRAGGNGVYLLSTVRVNRDRETVPGHCRSLLSIAARTASKSILSLAGCTTFFFL